MQIFGLPGHVIRSGRRASRLLSAKAPSSEVERRRDAVARWRCAMAQGLRVDEAAAAVGVPASTLYRWRKDAAPKSRRPHRLRKPDRPPALRAAVEQLRLDNPFWGKAKIAPVLKKQGFQTSEATVGRILSDLIRRGRVHSVPSLLRKHAAKAKAKKRLHAIRKPKDVTFKKPGDVIQIDTLSASPAPGRTVKLFDAYDPHAKWTVAKPYDRATAKNAADFLTKVLAEMPHKPKAIQIDGGSEFMAEFEKACKDIDLPLYVLPPRSPKLNGGVERCNQAWRYEFFASTDLPLRAAQIDPFVQAFQHKYNHHRPHGALAGMTPAEYLLKCRAEDQPHSQMS
jgi:putative transposase